MDFWATHACAEPSIETIKTNDGEHIRNIRHGKLQVGTASGSPVHKVSHAWEGPPDRLLRKTRSLNTNTTHISKTAVAIANPSFHTLCLSMSINQLSSVPLEYFQI